jgi:hypothetical protein
MQRHPVSRRSSASSEGRNAWGGHGRSLRPCPFRMFVVPKPPFSGRCSRQGKARGSRGWSDPETRSEINASKTPPITSFGINGPYPRGMFVGDARVSTQDQGLELQRGALEKVGCSKIFTDVEWRNESARRG